MKFFTAAKAKFPSLQSSLSAVLSAAALALAFPGFEFWFLAFFALVPLFWAIERESASIVKSFLLGWLWGTAFFFGTCWWLAYAPTHYGGMPAVVSYFLVLCATAAVGIFPAMFALSYSVLHRRFGVYAVLAAPFLWTAIEFLRFWTTGNNWNAIGYSQAFNDGIVKNASLGGVFLVGFLVVSANVYILLLLASGAFSFWKVLLDHEKAKSYFLQPPSPRVIILFTIIFALAYAASFFAPRESGTVSKPFEPERRSAFVVAVQPNVPMSGLKYEDWQRLREKHVELAENALRNVPRVAGGSGGNQPVVVIFPESPMNFRYEGDREFQEFLKAATARNDVNILFNSAEPDAERRSYFNSAVMVNEKG